MSPTVTSANRHQTKYKVNNPKVSSLSLSGYLQSVSVGGGRRAQGIGNDNRGVGGKELETMRLRERKL